MLDITVYVVHFIRMTMKSKNEVAVMKVSGNRKLVQQNGFVMVKAGDNVTIEAVPGDSIETSMRMGFSQKTPLSTNYLVSVIKNGWKTFNRFIVSEKEIA